MRQGVTTEIIGHCGFSVAPALPGKVELLRDYLAQEGFQVSMLHRGDEVGTRGERHIQVVKVRGRTPVLV